MQADLRLCSSHIPHCWKSHALAHIRVLIPPGKVMTLAHITVLIPPGKVMTSRFWDSQGVIMIYHLEQGRTINGAFDAGKMRRLRQEIARKRR